MIHLNVIFRVVVSNYRLVKNWNSPQFLAQPRNGVSGGKRQTTPFEFTDLTFRWLQHAFSEVIVIDLSLGCWLKMLDAKMLSLIFLFSWNVKLCPENSRTSTIVWIVAHITSLLFAKNKDESDSATIYSFCLCFVLLSLLDIRVAEAKSSNHGSKLRICNLFEFPLHLLQV